MTTPIWQTPSGFLGTLTERQTTATQLVATGTNISYSIVSGKLPVGLYLNTSTGLILGTPVSVSVDTRSSFVVRAKNNDGVNDRTFEYNVIGPSSPVWVTFVGALPVGLNGEYFAFNKEYVDYTVRAETDILTENNTIKYYIGDNEGQLPPGLSLSLNGRISGYINDDLAIDIAATVNGGYDTETYDFYPYSHNVITEDLNDPALNPKSLNKIYQFWITATDGIASSKRLFTIEVVDPDSFRADNTIISIDADTYDASAGYLLAPIWQNKYGDKLPQVHNLGLVRANKQLVLSLYDYDPYYLQGPAFYEWTVTGVNPDIKLYSDSQLNAASLPTKNLKGQNAIYFKNAEIFPVKGMKVQLNEYFTNFDSTIYTVTGVVKLTNTSGFINLDQPLYQRIPDSRIFYVGTKSQHPPGLSLDSTSGVLSGQIPYQPAYNNGYRFTVNVVKIDQSTGEITLVDAIGSNDGRIVGKIYSTSTANIPEELPSIAVYTGKVGDIILLGRSYPIIAERDPIYPTKLLPFMDGTTYAYAYTPTFYTLQQYAANAAGNTLTLEKTSGISPAPGWLIKNGSVSTTIEDVVDEENFLTLTLNKSISANTNSPKVIWSLGDPNVPCWSMIGQTVTEPQIYLINFLGEIPSSIKFISTASLGTLTPGEISEISVKAENTNTNYAIEYDLVQGTLPLGLKLNSDGSIVGSVKNSGQTYFDFNITTATFVGTVVNNVLTIDSIESGNVVIHQEFKIDDDQWVSLASGVGNVWNIESPNGIIFDKTTSTFFATTLSHNAYKNLPLVIDGGTTTIDKNWYFKVRASDVYRLSSVEQDFYITVYQETSKDYTRIFVKPFLSADKRMLYKNFVTNQVIFDPTLIYRPSDPEFGIQQQIKMIIEHGIEQVDINLYAEAMHQYFYRKKFYFGEIKSIRAQDENGKDVYEIIYVEIIDNQIVNNTTPSYAVSVSNMQKQIESIELDDQSIITVNERLLPKYITTLDPDTGVPLGFVKAVPICYTIPGGSTKILSRLKNALATGQFDFKNFNFDTDRIIIETVVNTQEPGWLLYPTERR